MTGATPSQPATSAGKIHLLDLTALKERLGSKWGRIAGHVQTFFESAIKRALMPGDTFCHFEELSYLVVFRGLSQAEAEFKCTLIAEEICKRLFGENNQAISLRSLVARVDPAKTSVGAAAELSAYLEREGRETIVTPDALRAPGLSRHNLPERTLRLLMSGSPSSRQRISSRGITFAYRPIWDTSNHVVLTYLCQPMLQPLASSAAAVTGLCQAEDETDQAFLDNLVLHECAERAGNLRRAGLRIILAVPVHFATIAQPRIWRDYSEVLRHVANGAATDFAFVVYGIDHGVPHVRLAQELPKLERLAYRVMCVVDRGRGAGIRFSRTGARGIGMILDEREDEPQAMARMQELAKEARAATIDSFVLGLRSTSLVLASIHSGLRYLEGPVVRPAVEDPRHGFAQGVEDIYRAKRLASTQ